MVKIYSTQYKLLGTFKTDKFGKISYDSNRAFRAICKKYKRVLVERVYQGLFRERAILTKQKENDYDSNGNGF